MAGPDDIRDIRKALERAKRSPPHPVETDPDEYEKQMGVRVSNAYQEYRTIRRADSSISREQAFEDAVRKYGIGGKGVNDLQETIEIRDIGDRVGDAFGEYEEMRRTASSVPQEKTFEEVVKKYGLEGVGVKALRDVIEGRGQMSDDERSDQKEERKIKED